MGKIMECIKCLKDLKDKDFINGNSDCYKCVYQEKLSKQKGPRKNTKCRICDEPCSENRWVYCSQDCAVIGELKMKKDYWTNNIKNVTSYSMKGSSR